MKIPEDIDFRDREVRNNSSFLRLLFALMNSGLAVFFVLISLRILFAGARGFSANQDFQWPLMMKVVSAVYVLASVTLVVSQILSFFGRNGAGRVLVLLLAFFLAVYSLEVLSAFELHGLIAFASYEFFYFTLLFIWVALNYFLWWPRKQGAKYKSSS